MGRRRRELRWTSGAILLATFAVLRAADAQPMPRTFSPRLPQVGGDRARAPSGSAGVRLRDRFGVDMARQLLASDDPKERMRGVERLGTIDDEPAVDALLEAIDSGSSASRDPDARLHAIRMLARHATEKRVRAFLARELLGGSGGRPSLLRSTAAMALASAGDQKALETLAMAIDQRGPANDAARAALMAFPPRTLGPFLFEPLEEKSDDADKIKSEAASEEAVMRILAERAREESAAAKTGKKKKPDDKPDPLADDDDGASIESPPKEHTRRARTLTSSLVDFFGELGDVRSLPALRVAAARKQIVVRAHAGLALARFGDVSGLADARDAAKGDDTRVLATSVETLVLLGDPAAAAALKKLIEAPATRSVGLDLLFGASQPALFRALQKDLETWLVDDTGAERSRIVLALGRASPARALRLLDGPEETRDAAAYALAISPEPEARASIEAGLAKAKPGADRRLLVRAAVVRWVALTDRVEGLSAALDRLLASSDDADREVGALGLVATGSEVAEVLKRGAGKAKSPPPSVVAGAARGALLGKADALASFSPILLGDGSPASDDRGLTLSQIAAGVALLDARSAAEVPQATLLAWAERGGPLAPLAARSLGARDDETIRSRIEELLHGSDPVIRANIASGLGRDPEPSSVTLLSDAYLTEDDASVRRAAIRALGDRSEVQRNRVLQWASDLDPDAGARSLARFALLGRPHAEKTAPVGSTLSFTRVARADGSKGMTAGRFVGADDLAIPVVSAADGVLLLPTPAFGHGSLTMSPDAAADLQSTPHPRTETR